MQLIIGNKNYSSWSMRPWVLMKQLGIPFEERKLRFDFSEGSAFRQEVARHSPAGKVPVLLDGELAVWDTLAITEYLAEKLPGVRPGVWPDDSSARARARSLVCEMHSGFGALRNHCPMNIEASLPEVGARVWAEQPQVRADVLASKAPGPRRWPPAADRSCSAPSAPPTLSSRRCALAWPPTRCRCPKPHAATCSATPRRRAWPPGSPKPGRSRTTWTSKSPTASTAEPGPV